MDSVRTRNLKELRQKRLQYFDKLQTQSTNQGAEQNGTSANGQKYTGRKTTSKVTKSPNKPVIAPKPSSILAWNTPESSPRLSKRQSVQNSATLPKGNSSPHFESLSNSTTSPSQSSHKGLTSKGSGSKKGHSSDVYSNPVRRSLTQAQIFSATHRLPQHKSQSSEDEFRYSFNKFKPVDRDRFFTTKTLEDATWSSSPDSKHTSLGERSTFSTSNPGIKPDDSSFDANYVENILHEMGNVRKIKTLVHNELKANFEKPNNKYDNDVPKYSGDVTKYGHLSTKDEVDINHNISKSDEKNIGQTYRMNDELHAGKTYRLNDEMNVENTYRVNERLDRDVQSTYRVNGVSDQDILNERDTAEITPNRKLLNQNESDSDDVGNGSKREEDDDDNDDEFDLGALQEAAKQGDGILRKYIKRLSQRLHDKAAQELSGGDRLDSKLQSKTVVEDCTKDKLNLGLYSEDDAAKDIDEHQKTKFEQKPSNAFAEERTSSIELGETMHEGQNLNWDGFVDSYHGNHKHEQFIKQSDSYVGRVSDDVSIARRNDFHSDHDLGNDLLSDHVSQNHLKKNGKESVMTYEPKIGQAAMTSNKLYELGLLDDMFAGTLADTKSAGKQYA